MNAQRQRSPLGRHHGQMQLHLLNWTVRAEWIAHMHRASDTASHHPNRLHGPY